MTSPHPLGRSCSGPPTVFGTALLRYSRGSQQFGGRVLVAQHGLFGTPQVVRWAPPHPPGRGVARDQERVLGKAVPGDLRLVRVETAAQLRADRQWRGDRG